MTRLTLLFFVLICGCFSATTYGQNTYTAEPEIDIVYHHPIIESAPIYGAFPNYRQFSVSGLPGATILPCNCPENADNNRYWYFWTFGDGSYSTEANPKHQYDLPGDYEVHVEVTPIYTEDEDIDQIRDDKDNPPQAGDENLTIEDLQAAFNPSDYDPTVYNKIVELELAEPIVLTTSDNYYTRNRNNSLNPYAGLFQGVPVSGYFYNRDARPGNPMTLVTTKATDEMYNLTFSPAVLELELEGSYPNITTGGTSVINNLGDIGLDEQIDISDAPFVKGGTCERTVLLKRLTSHQDFTQDDYRIYFYEIPGSPCAAEFENVFVNFTVNSNLQAGQEINGYDASSYIGNFPYSFDLGFKVVSSFDPNEKSVDKEIIDDTSEELTYTIDFQNYGTGPAGYIRVRENIPEHLEIASIDVLDIFVGADYDENAGVDIKRELLTTDNPGQMAPSNGNGNFWFNVDYDNRTIDFNMSNVHLVGLGPNPEDFCGQLTTQGQLRYKISTKPSAFDESNSSFGASADIYFDNNEPVTTNIAATQYVNPENILPTQGPDECGISYDLFIDNDCNSNTFETTLLIKTEGIYEISFDNGAPFEVYVGCGEVYSTGNIYPLYQNSDYSIEIFDTETNCTLEIPYEAPSQFPCTPETYSLSNESQSHVSAVSTKVRKVNHNYRDTQEYPGGIMFNNGYVNCSSSNSSGLSVGMMFTALNVIPENAKITSAYMKLRTATASSNAEDFVFQVEDNASPANFTSSTNNLSNRDMIPMQRIWDTPTNMIANKWYNVWGLTAMIQALVNRDDWDSSNGKVVIKMDSYLGKTGNPVLFHSFNTSSTYAPRLYIKYKAPIACKSGGYEEKEMEVSFDMTTYPNPATDFIQVDFDTAISDGKIEVFNLQGQMIMSEEVKEGDTGKQFDVSKLAKGIYLVKATLGDESTHHKVLVE